jgi:predicted Zn-dependent peptidase
VFAAAGKVSHDELVHVAECHLGELPAGEAQPARPALFTGGVRVKKVASEQAQLTLGFEGPAALSDDYFAARLFSDVVGGGASSRLFQALREDRGLAYTVSASLQPSSDTGLFSVHAATSPRSSAAAGKLIDEVLAGATRDATQRELDRVRTQARAGLLMTLETPWGQTGYAARQLSLYGRIVQPGEVVEQLRAVTLEDLREAGSRMLAGPRARATIGVPAARAA